MSAFLPVYFFKKECERQYFSTTLVSFILFASLLLIDSPFRAQMEAMHSMRQAHGAALRQRQQRQELKWEAANEAARAADLPD